MRALLWLLGTFSFAVALAVAARYNEGYALFVWAPWRIHISLFLLGFLLLALFGALYATTRLVAKTMALPKAVAAFRAKQKAERAAQALKDAQRFLFEGRYGRAFAQSVAAYEAGASPGLSALIAARAAHAMRESTRAAEWLVKAAQHDDEVRAARLMTEAEFAIADRQFDVAAERLETLRNGGARQIAALRLSLQVAAARGEWAEVLRLARQLNSHRALTNDQAAPLLRRAHMGNLHECEGDVSALTRYWESIPKAEREDGSLVRGAVPLLNAVGEANLAAEAISHVLDMQWDSQLAELFGRIEGGAVVERIAEAERWLGSHREDGRLLLALGRLCVQQQLWGKAQSYFEASLSIAPSRVAHLELARLGERLGREELALRHFRLAAETEEAEVGALR
ncbi:MAG: heme biosynthesis protein HemY [Betaproteobacteria bacterium]|nr:heme biosynthesis protein HemY [Betaproteobacteria bacterium]